MANANYMQNRSKYTQLQQKIPLHPCQGRQFDPENELQVVKTIEKPQETTQVRAKLFASIVKSIVHIHTALRALPCGEPSKCVCGRGWRRPARLLDMPLAAVAFGDFEFLGAPLGDDGLVHHQKNLIGAFRLLLQALFALGDAEVGVRLLCTCARYGRRWRVPICAPLSA